MAPQQPLFVDPQQQSAYPPSYDSAVVAPAPLGVGPWPAGVGQQQPPALGAYYVTDKVGEPYSSKPLPPQTGLGVDNTAGYGAPQPGHPN